MSYTIPAEYRPKQAPENLPDSAVSVAWGGTAGFRIVYKNSVLLIDPFVSRSGLFRTAFLRLPCNEALCDKYFPKADNIILGHSHHDHLLDVPAIAAKTGANVYGSPSTAAVCLGAGLPKNQIHLVKPGKAFECGAYRIKYIESLHGKAFLGRIPNPGEITGEPKQPMKLKEYRIGGVYGIVTDAGGFKMYHCGSADLIDEKTKTAGHVDLLMIGLAGRKKTPDYLKRLTSILKPKYIIPQHYDNFFKPLSKGLTLLYGIKIDAFLEEAKTVCPEAKIIMPELFEKVAFDTATHKLIY